MAERRMFAKTIVLSDAFLDMPLSARCLYFTLGMLADDDGFINSPKSIMRQCGASNDDMNLLLAKKFVIDFESGVVVIKHWRINNYLRNDRYTETKYIEEKSLLSIEENGGYTVGIPGGIPSIGKCSLGEDSLHSERNAHACARGEGVHGCVFLTDEEREELYNRLGAITAKQYIKRLDQFIFEKGATVADHFNTILKWWEEDKG